MEAIPSREEMIRMAQETRKHVTNAPVSEEEMNAYPAQVEKLEIPTRVGVSGCYLVRPQKLPGKAALVVNYHGGGFIRERTRNDELFCRRIANETGVLVLDVDYRLAPEHPFPEGLHESYDVAVWAWKHAEELGADPNRIVLTGHSAGGNFVLGICMMLSETKEFRPAGVISEYPPMDVATDPAEKEQRGKAIPPERARLYNLYYCEKEQQKNPLASPVFAGDEMLTHFPPTLLITAGEDSLCTEAEQFALRLAQAGNEVTLKRFPGVGHAFTIYRRPGFQEAMELIERYLRFFLKG